MYYITTATTKIRALKSRIRAIQGGTSASKTIGVLQNLIDFAQSDETPTLTSVVSESMPHIKKGSELDFLNILKQQEYYKEERWNRTDHQYHFESGSIIEFFSADDSTKVRGPRRDRLFINECNNIPFETFDQLELRTNEFVYLDWNPVEDFWFYEDVEGKRDDVELIILNYMDNEAINPEVKRSLEQRKHRVNWWKVYGLGQRGEIEGRVYKGWQIINEIPHEARLEGYGLDFGYDPDPAAIVGVYYCNGGYILDEELYQKGLLNSDLAAQLKTLSQKLIVADSAEPKSIAELRSYGLNVIGAVKGPDSVRHGVRIVQDQRVSVTKRSVNLIKEYRNYLQAQDKDGAFIMGEYVGADHALDAARYRMSSLVALMRRDEYLKSLPVKQFQKKKGNIAV